MPGQIGNISQFREFLAHIGPMADFQPFAALDETTDTLQYLERDCSITERGAVGSPLTILHDSNTDEVVGFRLIAYSKLSSTLYRDLKRAEEVPG